MLFSEEILSVLRDEPIFIGAPADLACRLDSANRESAGPEVYGAVRRDGQCCLKMISQADAPVIRKAHTITPPRNGDQ